MSSFTELVLLSYIVVERHSCICNSCKEDGSFRLRGANQVPKIMEGSWTTGRSIKAVPHTYQLFILARVKLSGKGIGKLLHNGCLHDTELWILRKCNYLGYSERTLQ